MPPLPTPFPIPTPDPEGPTINVNPVWSYDDFLAPIIGTGRTLFSWLDQEPYNILTYAIIAMMLLMIVAWLVKRIQRTDLEV